MEIESRKDLYWNFCVSLLVVVSTYSILWYANPVFFNNEPGVRNIWMNLGVSLLFGIFIYAILYHFHKDKTKKE